MAQVYWALGIRYADFRDRYELAEALDRFQAAKGEWSVLSYRIVAGDHAELGQAQESTGTTLQGDALHRFHLFQWNGQEMPGDDVSRIRWGSRSRPWPTPISSRSSCSVARPGNTTSSLLVGVLSREPAGQRPMLRSSGAALPTPPQLLAGAAGTAGRDQSGNGFRGTGPGSVAAGVEPSSPSSAFRTPSRLTGFIRHRGTLVTWSGPRRSMHSVETAMALLGFQAPHPAGDLSVPSMARRAA